MNEETKRSFPIGAPIHYIGDDEHLIPCRVMKHNRKYLTLETSYVGKTFKAEPKHCQHYHNFLKNTNTGTPISPDQLPKTGDPTFLPDVVKNAESQLIDLDGFIKKHVGVGWIEVHKADTLDYREIPYLVE